jgi:Bacteriophage head to tail connecting protein
MRKIDSETNTDTALSARAATRVRQTERAGPPRVAASEILARRDRLRATRGVWESHWQEIADRILPRQGSFTTRFTAGEKRTHEIFDATAALALERFSAALESMLTPRTQRWHHLRASDPALNDRPEVRAWFDLAEDILFAARYSPHANYASQQHEVYMSLGAFGTGVLFVGDDTERGGLIYRAVHLADCHIEENFQGRIDTLYRDFEYTARQAMQRWGDANPDAIVKSAEKEPERKFRFVHAVEPRGERDPQRLDRGNKTYASFYVAEEGRTILQESGFDEFPYLVSRYVTAPREVYGRSPAMTVLPDIKMLNEMNKTTIRQAQLAVEPPILVFDDGVLGRPDGFGLTPGYINYGGVSKDGRALMQPFQSGARVDIGLDMMEQRRRTINDAFLVTLFQILVDQPSMTATEAMIRAQEKGALLTPVMGRQQSEALGPMIERELAILQRIGRLPPMPDVLLEAEGEFDIEYDSPLSRAQKSEQVVGISRTFEVLAPLASAQPDIFDVFDGDALAQLAAEVNGVPQKVLNTPEEIQQMRQGRAASQQIQSLLAAAPAANQAAGALEKMVSAGAAPQSIQ